MGCLRGSGPLVAALVPLIPLGLLYAVARTAVGTNATRSLAPAAMRPLAKLISGPMLFGCLYPCTNMCTLATAHEEGGVAGGSRAWDPLPLQHNPHMVSLLPWPPALFSELRLTQAVAPASFQLDEAWSSCEEGVNMKMRPGHGSPSAGMGSPSCGPCRQCV